MAWPRGMRGNSVFGALKIFGIPIEIHQSWFVIVILVSWSLATKYFPSAYPELTTTTHWVIGVIAAVSLFICVLLHEFGHSLTARAYGIPVARVTLFIFGGVAQISDEPRKPIIELAIALAGPLVSAVIAAGCFFIAGYMPVHSLSQRAIFAIVQYLAFINVVILGFNLLPGLPLDGGRVLRAIIWALTGSLHTATRIASIVGEGLGWGMVALGIWAIVVRQSLWGGLWYIMIGLFLRNAARSSFVRASR